MPEKVKGFFEHSLPTFLALLPKKQPQRWLTLVFVSSFLAIIFGMSLILIFRPPQPERRPILARKITSLATAYGSQKHIFGVSPKTTAQLTIPALSSKQPAGEVAGVQKILNGSLVVIWLKENQIVASFSNDGGESWEELSSPLIAETVANVAGEQDENGDLHLVYEKMGEIYYCKVTGLVADGRIRAEGWEISSPVSLDLSGLAHRPSLILDFETDLPLVAWSSESIRAGARYTRINFLRAKSDPTQLANWCSAQKTDCGKPAYILVSGSADSLGLVFTHGVLHPVLAQMPGSGDIYLWWSESTRRKKAVLKLAVADKEGERWNWGEAREEDKLDAETYKKFSLAAVADPVNNQIVVVYAGEGGETKMVAYKNDGTKEDLSPGEDLGGQFSLTTWEGKYYIFYRKDDGKIAGQVRSSPWSGEIFRSKDEGGYPSATTNAAEEKLYVVYTTPAGNINFLVYSLVKPSPSPSLLPSPTEEAIPPEEVTPSGEEPSPEPTEEPSPSPELAPSEEPIPTPEPSPSEEPSPTPEASPSPLATPQ